MKNTLAFFFLMSLVVHNNIVIAHNQNDSAYSLFKSTPASGLAEALEKDDTDVIRKNAQVWSRIVNYQEKKYGSTLLEMAVYQRKYNSVKALLELGADPNIQNEANGTSALMEAAQIGEGGLIHPDADVRFLKILLLHGGDPNAIQHEARVKRNSTFFSTLMFACLSGVYEYVKILVDAGANVNLNNPSGFSPLYAATVSGNPDVIMYLLKNGADFKQPMYTNVKGEKKYIMDALKLLSFEKGSENDKKLALIINFLRERSIK